MLRRTSEYIELRALWEVNCARVRGHFSAWRLYFVATLKRPYFLSFSPTVRVCVCAHIIDQGLVCLIRSIDSNMADLGLHITLLPIIGQALPRSAATCQNQLLVLQIGLCLFLYVFPVFEHLSVLFCSVLLFLGAESTAATNTEKRRDASHLYPGQIGSNWHFEPRQAQLTPCCPAGRPAQCAASRSG